MIIEMNNFGKDLDFIFESGFKRFYIFKNMLFYYRKPKIIFNENNKLTPFAFILKTNKIYFDDVFVYENGKIKQLNKYDRFIPVYDLKQIKKLEILEWEKKNEKQLINIANKVRGKIFYNDEFEIYKLSNGSLKIFYRNFE